MSLLLLFRWHTLLLCQMLNSLRQTVELGVCYCQFLNEITKKALKFGYLDGVSNWIHDFFFPHRAFAAFAAIRERVRLGSFLALAMPPLRPPSRPSATACGFLDGSAGFSAEAGSNLGASPMDSRNIWCARELGSRGRFVQRSGMADLRLRLIGFRSQDAENRN